MALLKITCIFAIFLTLNNFTYGHSVVDQNSFYPLSFNRFNLNRPSLRHFNCQNTKSFYDQEGNFLKYICWYSRMGAPCPYDYCEYNCYINGMDMLIVDNESVYLNLRNYLNENFKYPSFKFWLNGRKFGEKWFSYRNNVKIPLSTFVLFKDAPGNCYAFDSPNSTSLACESQNYCLCEFASTQ